MSAGAAIAALLLLAAEVPDERSGLAGELARHDIHLAGDAAAFEIDLLRELVAGLHALPPGRRRPPGGPLELELHAAATPYGMGDGSASAPEWTSGLRRFHLYRFGSGGEPRAGERLGALSPAERERLWRRRALIHAVAARWDADQGWSRSWEWRRLNGWVFPLERPFSFREHALNTYAFAYSRSRGQVSAALDLATFAEESLAPAESLRADALGEADQVRCQEMSKERFLREVGLLEKERGRCAAFESWADVGSLADVEVLFVSASGRAPESLFGHLLVRLVRRYPDRVAGPSFEPAVQLVALTGGDVPGPLYALRGLSGQYSLAVVTTGMSEVSSQLLHIEQRTMRRFRLRLSPSERERLLERIWELERRGYFAYFFLSDNCAWAAGFLVDGVLEGGRRVRLPSRLSPQLPAAALDAFTAARAFDGGPLLEPVAGAIESPRDEARRAWGARQLAAAQLLARVPEGRRHGAGEALADAERADPARRVSGYSRLARLVDGLGPDEVSAMAPGLYAFLAESARIERFSAEAAEMEAIRVKVGALGELPQLGSAEEDVRARQERFRREAALARATAVLDRVGPMLALLERLPRRELSGWEREIVHRAKVANDALDRTVELQAEAAATLPVDPIAYLRAQRAKAQAAEGRRLSGAVARSGYGRWRGAAGVLWDGGRLRPILEVASSVLEEELGDQRAHGLDPATGVTALSGDVRLALGPGWPEVLASRFRLASWSTLRREPEIFRRGPQDALGYGLATQWTYQRARRLPHRGEVDADALVVLDEAPDFARFAALGLGVRAALGSGGGEVGALAGPRLSFRHRLHVGGSGASWLALEAEYAPAFELPALAWAHAARASAEVNAPLALGPWQLLVALRGFASWQRDVRGEWYELGFLLRIEP